MNRVIIFFFLVFGFFHANAQFVEDDDGPITKKKFLAQLDRIKVAYMPPKGYELIYDSHNARLGSIILTGSRHQLKALKDSVLIYFALFQIDTTKALSERLKKFGMFNDLNQNYLKVAGRDTVNNPIVYDSRDVSRNKYGADRSGTYDLTLPGPYKDQYWLCKTLFIHKESRADIWLYFFYNPGSARKLNKHIVRISKTIKFLD
ncbi:hypothetical protein [Pedobacter ginsengisoli]|uniref:hypothetical protein n=1 Tax=Pedobacter ginsengisoli TaxID=363852 RepID=UPI002551BB5B|nr:hypothetical protein [Pedobacter ginsengisoli]